jgi:DNA-binding PadR family transcriptional regulator
MDTSNTSPRSDVSNAEMALLGLLAEGAKHPYQIEKDVQLRDMRAWTDLSMSSIYKVLHKLERRRWVEARAARSPENRRRRVFQLTASGGAALREAVRRALATHAVARNPFDLAIYNSNVLSADETRASLAEYGRKLDQALECYRALRQFLQKEGCPAARQALARRAVAMLEGEKKWLKAYLKGIED